MGLTEPPRRRNGALGRRTLLSFAVVVILMGTALLTQEQGWQSQQALLDTASLMATTSTAATTLSPPAKDSGTSTTTTSRTDPLPITTTNHTACHLPLKWSGQAGQDGYLYERVFKPQDLCDRGIFVEFGARDGREHSNTWALEASQRWTGLLFEIDSRDTAALARNRPQAQIVDGAVCPRSQSNITILLSRLRGWTGSEGAYEPTRKHEVFHTKVYPCRYLADELRQRHWHRVDYMTIDTEGSELAIVLDFPWDDFDVRVVQIEQLHERKYKAQAGRKAQIIAHLESFGYKLLSVYAVDPFDTDDLILTRNLDDFLAQAGAHPRDGDYSTRQQPPQQSLPKASHQELIRLAAARDPASRNRMANRHP